MKLCYLCGKEMLLNEITKDHVIPDCFYSAEDKKRGNLPTVKAHKDCNEAFSAIEDYVRDCYLFAHSPDSYPEQNEKLREKYRILPGYRQLLLDTTQEIECFTSKGKSIGKHHFHLTDVEAHEIFIRKIVRGLVFAQKLKDGKRNIIPSDVTITIYRTHIDESFNQYSSFTNVTKLTSFDRVWKYWGWIEPNTGDVWNGIIDIILFNSMRFNAFLGRSDKTESEDSTFEQPSDSKLILLKEIGEMIIDGKRERIFGEILKDAKSGTPESVIKALRRIRTDIFTT